MSDTFDPLVARAAEDDSPPADPRLAVTLPRSSWDAIVTLLGGYPYCQVAAMIDAIKLQNSAQLAELRFFQALLTATNADTAKH